MRPRFQRHGYQPPARDSEQAKANATMLLFGATDAAFERITPESLAQDKCLSLKVAEYMLTIARQKRAVSNG